MKKLMMIATLITGAPASSATAPEPVDATWLAPEGPVSLCDLSADALPFVEALWRAKAGSRAVTVAGGVRALVARRVKPLGDGGKETTVRATPVLPITWRDLPVTSYEDIAVSIPESHGPTTRRMALGVPLAVLQAELARLGRDAPVAPARAVVDDFGAHGVSVWLEPVAGGSAMVCQTND